MKKMLKKFAWLILLCLLVSCPALADEAEKTVDFAGRVTLNLHSETVKQEVTVKTYVDGDTTHFLVPESVMEGGVLKARYLAVNTPETTGKIEEYGKKAAQFTREKLSNATSIIIESDTGAWNKDSTGDRYLVWIWYKQEGMEEYRNLNIEILQNGLANPNAAKQNRYGDICMAAVTYAREQKLNIFSGQRDPDFYYGDAVELTLRELRCNPEAYEGIKVAFNGVITMNSNNSVFLEAYDAETDRYYGISVYYGHNMSGTGLEILSVGNEARIVGTVQYYEAVGTWQVSGLTYRGMKPKDPSNIQKISEGHLPAYVLTDPDSFANMEIIQEVNGEEKAFSYAELALATSIEMKNLTVTDAYTTTDEDSSSHGAITLSCMADGIPVKVRTGVLYDENRALITQDLLMNQTIDVKGIVDYYEGEYQIKVFSWNAITIHP